MDFQVTTGSIPELAKLDHYLATHAYIEGYSETQHDVRVWRLVPNNLDAKAYPHVNRWATHIGAFTPAQRARWVKGKVTLDDAEEKKAAPQEKKAGKKGSDKPEKKSSDKPQKKGSNKAERKDSKKDSKKDKKNKKNKGKKEEEETIPEEPAAEEEAAAEEAAPAEEAPAEDDDDMAMSFDDLANDDDDDEATKQMFAKQKDLVKTIQDRQAAQAGKAKSNLTMDVKPFDTETDMAALEQKIRGIEIEGLKWLGGQLIDVAYGIKKLRIMCQLVDVLVNPDTVREEVEKFEDEVQSTDVFAFQMA